MIAKILRLFQFVLLFAFLLPGLLLAGEAHPDNSPQLKHHDTKLSNQVLTQITENQAFINGDSYLITSQTKFMITEKTKRIISLKKGKITRLRLPCIVDIVYRSYSFYTEAKPYHGDRVLLSVTIKKKHLGPNRIKIRGKKGVAK